jgi:hypothetical protein
MQETGMRLFERRQDERAVDHTVLLRADQLLAVEDENVDLAVVLDQELGYRALTQFGNAERARRDHIPQKLQIELAFLRVDQREDRERFVLLRLP